VFDSMQAQWTSNAAPWIPHAALLVMMMRSAHCRIVGRDLAGDESGSYSEALGSRFIGGLVAGKPVADITGPLTSLFATCGIPTAVAMRGTPC
jgi:hypothetical protein